MANENKNEILASTEEAKIFLGKAITEQVDKVKQGAPDLKADAEEAKEVADKLISGMEIGDGVEIAGDDLWVMLLNEVYKKRLPLVEKAKAELELEVAKQTRETRDVRQILSGATKFNYIRYGGLEHDAAAAGKLLGIKKDGLALLDEYFFEDFGMTEMFLADAWENMEEMATSGTLPQNNFMLLQQRGEEKMVLGVERDKNGIKNLGMQPLEAPCRRDCFDRLMRSAQPLEVAHTKEDVGEKVWLVTTTEAFEDYPEAFSDPYKYPDELFLLRAGTSGFWGAIDLKPTAVSEVFES